MLLWHINKGWMKSLEKLLTTSYKPSLIRGQHTFNQPIKLDTNSHSLNDSPIQQITLHILVYWSPDVFLPQLHVGKLIK